MPHQVSHETSNTVI